MGYQTVFQSNSDASVWTASKREHGADGVVGVSSIDRGLFLLKPRLKGVK